MSSAKRLVGQHERICCQRSVCVSKMVFHFSKSTANKKPRTANTSHFTLTYRNTLSPFVILSLSLCPLICVSVRLSVSWIVELVLWRNHHFQCSTTNQSLDTKTASSVYFITQLTLWILRLLRLYFTYQNLHSFCRNTDVRYWKIEKVVQTKEIYVTSRHRTLRSAWVKESCAKTVRWFSLRCLFIRADATTTTATTTMMVFPTWVMCLCVFVASGLVFRMEKTGKTENEFKAVWM